MHISNLNKMKPKLRIEEPEQPWFIYSKKKKELTRNCKICFDLRITLGYRKA